MKPSTTAERLQEAMNIRGLKQVDVLRLAEPYCRAYGVNLGKTALTQYVSGKMNIQPKPNGEKNLSGYAG